MMMRFAAHQPNFCPWVGYFVKLHAADIFVILDDVQMPGGQSYVSRSKIRGAGSAEETWLSVPTGSKFGTRISDVRIGTGDGKWKARHLNLLQARYRGCPHFSEVYNRLESIYLRDFEYLIDFNMALLMSLIEMLQIKTSLVFSSKLGVTTTSDQRLADIGTRIGATQYLSGAGGNNYQSQETYNKVGIQVLGVNVRQALQGLPNVGLSTIDHLMEVGPTRVRGLIENCKPVSYDMQSDRIDPLIHPETELSPRATPAPRRD